MPAYGAVKHGVFGLEKVVFGVLGDNWSVSEKEQGSRVMMVEITGFSFYYSCWGVVLGISVSSRVGVLRDLDRLVGLALVAAKLVVKGECEEAARLADEIVRVAERVAVGLRSLSAST